MNSRSYLQHSSFTILQMDIGLFDIAGFSLNWINLVLE